MILIDFNQIVISRMYMFQKQSKTGDDIFINPLLKKALTRDIFDFIRNVHFEYGSIYGDVIMVADGDGQCWRYDIFEHYKAGRKKASADVKEMKKFVKGFIHEFYLEYRTGPTIVYKIDGIEADDIIGYLVTRKTDEKHMIVSRDKDFHQLHNDHVVSYDYVKKYVVRKNGPSVLAEHIIRGDNSDSIPNILSDANTHVDPAKRQTPMTKPRFDECMRTFIYPTENQVYDQATYDRFQMNKQLISLKELPLSVVTKIRNHINEL